ncbi:hypothetical protein ES708_17938 [subsurface metagenome]
MARHEGGIFSRPRGKTGGIVFGAARTREGKMVTSRLLVSPSNPRTADQVVHRLVFSDCLDITRSLGAVIYQDDWNRAIAQLPGFQSMMSVLMKASGVGRIFDPPPDVNLGTLGFPPVVSFGDGEMSGELTADWSGTAPEPQNAADIAVFLAIENFTAAPLDKRKAFSVYADTRADAVTVIADLEPTSSYLCALYFRGAVGEDTEGYLSIVRWGVASAPV